MIGWLKRFFCPHDWETVINHRVDRYEDSKQKIPYRFDWILVQRCKKCGKIQKNIIKV